MTSPDLGNFIIASTNGISITDLAYNFYHPTGVYKGASWAPNPPGGCKQLSFAFVRQAAGVYDIVYLTNSDPEDSTASAQLKFKTFAGDGGTGPNTFYTLTIPAHNTLALNLGRTAGSLVPDLDRDGNPHLRDWTGSLHVTSDKLLQGAKVKWSGTGNHMSAVEASCATDTETALYFPLVRRAGDDGATQFTAFWVRNRNITSQTLNAYFINSQGTVIQTDSKTVGGSEVWPIDTRNYPLIYSNAYPPIGLAVIGSKIVGYGAYTDNSITYSDTAAYLGVSNNDVDSEVVVPNLWCLGTNNSSEDTRLLAMLPATSFLSNALRIEVCKTDGTLQTSYTYSMFNVADIDLCAGLPTGFGGTAHVTVMYSPYTLVGTVLDRHAANHYVAANEAVGVH